MKRIYLVRHPHVQAAEEGICYGGSHVPLSERGMTEARLLEEYFSQKPLRAVYASDLPRAAHPAGLVAQRRGLEARLLPQLREIDCGAWSSLSYKEIEERYPREFQKWISLEDDFAFPDGESLSLFSRRINEAFLNILNADGDSGNGENELLIISHAGGTRAILLKLLQMPYGAAWSLGQDFACINIVEQYNNAFVVRLLNGSPDGSR